jgi:hypothetical protein
VIGDIPDTPAKAMDGDIPDIPALLAANRDSDISGMSPLVFMGLKGILADRPDNIQQ